MHNYPHERGRTFTHCKYVYFGAEAFALKFTLVVGNDTTLHRVHTDTVAFSHAVLIKCSICSDHQSLTRTPNEWLKKTIHDIWNQTVICCHHFGEVNAKIGLHETDNGKMSSTSCQIWTTLVLTRNSAKFKLWPPSSLQCTVTSHSGLRWDDDVAPKTNS